MADMPNDFWSGWIIVITVVSLATLVWMIFSIYFSKKNRQLEQSEEPIWDDDLREGTNAPPLWWFWLILASLIFSVVYLMLYPGLGDYRGALQWSQDSRLQNSYVDFERNFTGYRSYVSTNSYETLQQDRVLMATAERIFARNCAACHGTDGRGQINLFPNLMDRDWQWGDSAEQIEQTIREGRQATMVAWQDVLGERGVTQVSNYILSLSKPDGIDAAQHPGHPLFNQYCTACHAADGSGNIQLGAPDLTDDIWLYGGDVAAVKMSIANGRSGVMPAFGTRLDDVQIKLLVAWLAR